MKISIKSFILLFSLFLISCHPDQFQGKATSVRNNSSEYIYFWYSGDFSVYHYPDTILPIEKPLFIAACSPGNGEGIMGYDPDYNNIFNQLPDGKFTIYFFDELATTQEEWEDIRVNHMVLRKDTTFEELKNNDYIIYYP